MFNAKEYYIKNKEKIKEYAKQYRIDNLEKIKKRKKRRRYHDYINGRFYRKFKW